MEDTGYWNEELETKPWREVEAWQAGNIETFLESLVRRSEFYRVKLARTAGSLGRPAEGLERLSELPFTLKDELRRSQEIREPGRPLGTHQAALLRDIVQVITSSGTTGNPMYYGLTRRDLEMWSDGIACFFFTIGIRQDDVCAHLVGLPMVAGGLPYADGIRRIGATLAWLGGYPNERILGAFSRLNVTALFGTASFGMYITDHGEQLLGHPLSQLGLKKFVGGGEPGMGQMEIREKISRGWGPQCQIREAMGLGDVMSGMWAECEAGGGMHFTAQRYVIVELINPDTGERIPWAEGASGEAVYTTLDREATPLLRFRSADHMIVTGMSCSCGRTSPKARCIGRTDDMLIYKGMNVFSTAIRDVILTRFSDVLEPHLRIWKDEPKQVRFEAPIPLEVEARAGVAPERFSGIAEAIIQEIRKQLQVRVAPTVVPAGTIPRSLYKTSLVAVKSQ